MPQKDAKQPDDTLDVIETIDVPIIAFAVVAAVTFGGLIAADWVLRLFS
jgi:hypothetical protein